MITRVRLFGVGLMVASAVNVILFGLMLPEAAFAFSTQLAWVVAGYFMYRHQDRILLRNFVL